MVVTSRVQVISDSGIVAQDPPGGIYLHINTETEVVALSPSVGPVSGGFEVTVHGKAFSGVDLSCCFGSIIINANVRNDTLSVCVAPPATVSLGPVSFSHGRAGLCMLDDLTFLYVPIPQLDVLEPNMSASVVDTSNIMSSDENVVTIVGDNFVKGSLWARFDSIERACSVVDMHAAKCPVPRGLPVGFYTVAVSNDRQFYSKQRVKNFEVYNNPSVFSVVPVKLVPMLSGHSILTVSGFNFAQSLMLKCGFGDFEVLSKVVSQSILTCAIPSIEQLRTTAISHAVKVSIMSRIADVTLWSTTMPIHEEPRLHRIEPTSGPLKGGALITISGAHFLQDSTMCRFAGGIIALARVISSSKMLCVTPTASTAGAVSIEAVISNLSMSSSAATFLYTHPPAVYRVWPNSDTSLGRSWVSIYGDHMWNSSTLQVKFGRTSASVLTWMSSSLVLVLTPKSPVVGNLTLTVLTTDNLKSNGISFEFMAETVPVFTPSHGPGKGGTILTVHGRNLGNVSACRVGTHMVKAGSGTPLAANGQQVCQLPVIWPDRPKSVAVTIIFSDGREIPTGHNYTFDDEVVIGAVLPSAGSMKGSETVITIFGAGFQNVPELTCLIGKHPIQGTFYSSSEMKCILPPMPPGRISVDVSNNGNDFTRSETVFTVLKSILVHAIDPATIVVHADAPQVVTVFGEGFQSMQVYHCQIGGVLSNATWITDSELQCRLPYLKPGNFSVSVVVDRQEKIESGTVFQIIRPVSIQAPAPSIGPVHGGTIVTVIGVGFESGGLSCRFGTSVVSASIVSASCVVCSTPAHAQADITVQLMHQQYPLHQSQHFFRFVDESWPFVTSIWPSHGPTTGGTAVTIHGRNLRPESECIFGHTRVPIARLDNVSGAIVCSSPSGLDGEAVAVSLSRISSGFEFEYYSAPSALSLSPQYGSLTDRNILTIITVTGTGFSSGKQAGCRIGGIATPGKFVNDATILCQLHSQDTNVFSTFGRLPVEVSLNLVDFVVVDMDFLHTLPPKVLAVHPSIGPSAGFSRISVIGSDFGGGRVMGLSSMVLFGAVKVEALFATSSMVTCISPLAEQEGAHAVFVSVVDHDSNYSNYDSKVAFEYYNSILIFKIQPSRGLSPDGATMTVFGHSWATESSVTCKFGAMEARGIIVSSTSMLCISPATAPGSYTLEVSRNGNAYSKSGHFVQFEAVPIITDVSPSSLPVTESQALTIRGLNLHKNMAFACSVGQGNALEIRWASDSEISCIADIKNPGNLSIAISNDGVVFSKPYMILATAAIHLGSLYPSQAPASGGTLVTVNLGMGMSSYPKILCRFSHTVSEMIYLSSSFVQCLTPALPVSVINVELVTANGVAISNALPFIAYTLPSVSEIQPSIVSTFGGCLVSVRGYNFRPGALKITFGDQSVNATFVSDTLLLCFAPFHSAGSVPLAVSNNNGVDFSPTASIRLRFSPTPTIYAIQPSSSAVDILTVLGADFREGISTSCKFGADRIVPAQFVSSSQLMCNRPLDLGGNVSTQVTNNGIEYSEPLVVYVGQQVPNASALSSHTSSGQVDPSISHISPTMGETAGAAIMTVRGRDFPVDIAVRCMFGEEMSHGSILSVSEVHCTIPSTPQAGAVKLALDFQGIVSTQEEIRFEYVAPMQILDFTPRSSPIAGGIHITLHGEGFVSQTSLYCQFGYGILNPALIGHNASQIVCLAPASRSGNVTVGVSTASGYGVRSPKLFKYFGPMQVLSVNPSTSQLIGGNRVTVLGRNFVPSVACVFGSMSNSAPALMISSEELECVVPQMFSAGQSSLAVNASHLSLVSNPVPFSFFDADRISIFPSVGPVLGGTRITIRGPWVDNSRVSIVFNKKVVPHINIDGVSLEIISISIGEAGHATLDVLDKTSGRGIGLQQFMFFREAEILSITPSLMSSAKGKFVTVVGSGFQVGIPYGLKFGSEFQPDVTAVSSTMLRCSMPLMPVLPGSNLHLVLGDYTFESSVAFENGDLIDITSISPTLSSNAGGFPLQLKGVGFSTGSQCLFGNELYSSAVMVSSTSLSCHVPFMNPGAVKVQIVSASFATSNVEDQTVISNAMDIWIHEPVKLTAVKPIEGYSGYEVKVEVTGTNFDQDGREQNGLACIFGKNHKAPALLVFVADRVLHAPGFACRVECRFCFLKRSRIFE